MIHNVVTQMLSYKKAQFEEKIKNPQSLGQTASSSFQEQLSASGTAGSASAAVNTVDGSTGISINNQEFTRRFGNVSASDKWGVLQKYSIQPISPKNAEKYADIIEEMSAKYGVPKQLIQKMIETESNFNPQAVSHAGAAGLMQLMPANQREHGITDPTNPRQNIEGGVKEIAGYLKQYNGDLITSLAAYNAGPGNVKKYGGVPPFKETERYIQKILGIAVR